MSAINKDRLEHPVTYVCANFPCFSFRISDIRYKFVDKQLQIKSQASVDELDDLLANNHIFAAKIKKVDRSTAEDIFKKELERKALVSGFVRGGATAQNILNAQTPLHERDAAFDAMPAAEKNNIMDTMKEDSNLLLTQKVSPPVDSTVIKQQPQADSSIGKLLEKQKPEQ